MYTFINQYKCIAKMYIPLSVEEWHKQWCRHSSWSPQILGPDPNNCLRSCEGAVVTWLNCSSHPPHLPPSRIAARHAVYYSSLDSGGKQQQIALGSVLRISASVELDKILDGLVFISFVNFFLKGWAWRQRNWTEAMMIGKKTIYSVHHYLDVSLPFWCCLSF